MKVVLITERTSPRRIAIALVTLLALIVAPICAPLCAARTCDGPADVEGKIEHNHCHHTDSSGVSILHSQIQVMSICAAVEQAALPKTVANLQDKQKQVNLETPFLAVKNFSAISSSKRSGWRVAVLHPDRFELSAVYLILRI